MYLIYRRLAAEWSKLDDRQLEQRDSTLGLGRNDPSLAKICDNLEGSHQKLTRLYRFDLDRAGPWFVGVVSQSVWTGFYSELLVARLPSLSLLSRSKSFSNISCFSNSTL